MNENELTWSSSRSNSNLAKMTKQALYKNGVAILKLEYISSS
jgi:outer membrane lipopolysaccharide assembly protein LptE/RlpB